jgi:hypothetical protein
MLQYTNNSCVTFMLQKNLHEFQSRALDRERQNGQQGLMTELHHLSCGGELLPCATVSIMIHTINMILL